MHNRAVRGTVAILLRRLLMQPKLYLVIILLTTILDEYVGSARHIAQQYSISVNAYGSFACLLSYSYLMLWIVLGYLVLVSDVPFVSEITLFESIRITPQQSLIARILYIFTTSILYVILVFLIASLIQFASFLHPFEWDKALRTMSLKQAVGDAYLYIPSVILSAYSPIRAWSLACGLLICALTSMGLMMLLGSLLIDKRIVISIAGIIAALDFAVFYGVLPDNVYYYSPLSWCRIELPLNADFYVSYPSASYCLLMLVGLLLVLCFAALLVLTRSKWFTHKMTTLEGN